MRRFIITSLLLTGFLMAYAQQAESVFLDKKHLAWFDKEIAKYNTSLDYINNAQGKKIDKHAYYKHKKQVQKSLQRFNNNGLTFYNLMATHLDEEVNERLRYSYGDGHDDSDLERKIKGYRNAKNMLELKMTQADLDAYLDNLSAIKNVFDEMKTSNDFWSVSDIQRRNQNIDKLDVVHAKITANKDLLNSKLVN